jgi:hypothetical protein
MAKILEKQTSRTIELAVFNPEHPLKMLDAKNVDWMANIIRGSQKQKTQMARGNCEQLLSAF